MHPAGWATLPLCDLGKAPGTFPACRSGLFQRGRPTVSSRERLEELVGLTMEHWHGAFRGHVIEVVYNNWIKTFALKIDGEQVARAGRILPRDLTLTATLLDGEASHEIVARSIAKFPFEKPRVEIDGEALRLFKVR